MHMVKQFVRILMVVSVVADMGKAGYAASFDCLIEPFQTVELGTPVTGMLERVEVRRGDAIAKGQILAALESRAEQSAAELARYRSEQIGPMRLAENKREFSRRKFDRRRGMAAEQLMSEQESDDAEAEFKLAESELQVAKENRQIARLEFQQQSSLLNLRTIRSPFDGVVVEQMHYAGEVVEPGAAEPAILKVAQLDPLSVHAILPKEMFGKLAVGMTADVVPEIPTGHTYTARVTTIDRLVDAASGTFVVNLELANPKLEILAGVRCRATFIGNGPSATDKGGSAHGGKP
jgi:RND family efflux transporter MFP subunit